MWCTPALATRGGGCQGGCRLQISNYAFINKKVVGWVVVISGNKIISIIAVGIPDVHQISEMLGCVGCGQEGGGGASTSPDAMPQH